MKYHTDTRSYTLPEGILSENGVCEIYQYLQSLSFQTDGELPKFEEWMESVCPQSEWPQEESGAFHIGNYLMEYNYHYTRVAPYPGTVAHWQEPHHRDKNIKALFKRWHRAFYDRLKPVSNPWGFDLSPLGNQWNVTGKAEYVGTYPKRLARYLKAKYDVKLDSRHIETIGNIGGAHVSKQSDYLISFDNDFLTGDSREYCNSGSCWWGDGQYSGSRQAIYDADGYAIRAWEDGKPIARAWIAPLDDGNHIVFNAYGKLTSLEFARLLSQANGLIYKQVNLYCDDDGIYINSNRGVIIGKEVSKIDDVYLPWETESVCQCSSCGDRLDPEESYANDNGESFCECCFHDLYSYCERCSETIPTEDVVRCGNTFYCEYCAEREGYRACDGCSEMRDDTVDCEGDEYCQDCADRQGYRPCDGCSEYTQETSDCNGDEYCQECADDQGFSPCQNCDTMTDELSELGNCETCASAPSPAQRQLQF